MAIALGVDIFLDQADRHKHKTWALVTNQASVTSGFRPTREALLSAGYKIKRLFSPEHGLEAIGEDGRPMPDGTDRLTGLPFFSLYGSRLEPGLEHLADIDAVIFDLPNVGCRFYTYLWTLTHVMEACHRHGKELLVLDRPNLISGNMELAEGPALDEKRCASFAGRWPIPVRYSCTFAELATFWAASRMPELRLTTVAAQGWNRNSFVEDWSTSFVPTSPAIANPEAALLYPGVGLLEATNLSEGRGTSTPFRVTGAPWMDAATLAKQFNSVRPPGVVARAVDFTPTASKYCHVLCRGLMLHVTDRTIFRPVFSAMMLIKLVRDCHPDHFAWSPYPTEVNPSGERHLDKLLGVPDAESMFEEPLTCLLDRLHTLLDCQQWRITMKPFLIYGP